MCMLQCALSKEVFVQRKNLSLKCYFHLSLKVSEAQSGSFKLTAMPIPSTVTGFCKDQAESCEI